MAKRDGQGIKREKSEAMKQTEEWNAAKSRIENQIKELRHRSRRGASGASHRDLRVPGRAAHADGGELFKAPVR